MGNGQLDYNILKLIVCVCVCACMCVCVCVCVCENKIVHNSEQEIVNNKFLKSTSENV